MDKLLPVSAISLVLFLATMGVDLLAPDALPQALESATGPTRSFVLLLDILTKDPVQAVEFLAGVPALGTVVARFL